MEECFRKWNKRKIIILVFCVGFVLAGCVVHGLSLKEPVKIIVWNYYNGIQKDAFDVLVKEFNETEGKEKKIQVESVSKGSIQNLIEALRQSEAKEVGAAELPNVFNTYPDFAVENAQDELIADLEPYLTEDEIKQYRNEFIEEGRLGQDKGLKIFPIAKSTEILMVNGTLWDSFAEKTGAKLSDLSSWEGVAETAENYYNYTDALTSMEDDGKAFFGRDALANYIFVGSKQLGSEILQQNADGKEQICLNKAILKKIWDCYYIPYVKGYYAKNGKYATDDAKTGDIIAFVGSTVSASYFPQEIEYPDGRLASARCIVLPLPNFKGTKPYCIQQGAGMSVIKSDELHESASVIFLKWITQEDRNISFCIESGYLPVKKTAYDFTLWEKVLKQKERSVSPVMVEALQKSINQMQSSVLFTGKAVNCSYDARMLIEQSLGDKAKEDREIVKQKMQKGISKEHAVEEFISKEYFEAWFSSINEEMKGLVKGEYN